MGWGDYGVIFKWIDNFIKKGQVRRAKKLTALQKDLEHIDEDIKLAKRINNLRSLESLLLERRVLEKKIQSLAR